MGVAKRDLKGFLGVPEGSEKSEKGHFLGRIFVYLKNTYFGQKVWFLSFLGHFLRSKKSPKTSYFFGEEVVKGF
jgi:hypothetical protein